MVGLPVVLDQEVEGVETLLPQLHADIDRDGDGGDGLLARGGPDLAREGGVVDLLCPFGKRA